MRVLHIDFESGFRGGQQQVMLLLKGLVARGVEVLLVARKDGELAKRAKESGIAVEEFARPGLLGIRHPILWRKVRAVAQHFHPDIVHAHSASGHTLAYGAFGESLPIVVSRRVDFAPKTKSFFSRGKFLAPNVHFIAISEAIAKILRGSGIDNSRVSLVYSGTDPVRVRNGNGVALRREWLAGKEGPIIGFIGALVEHKAPERLIATMTQIKDSLPGSVLVYIGDDVDGRKKLEALAKPLADRVVFAGWRNDIADVYNALDIFVMPSREEGLCTSLIDALFAGVPAVGSDGGGIPEVLAGGDCGVVVPNASISDGREFAQPIIDLWKSEEKRHRLIAAGTERAEKLFTANAMAEGNLAVYAKVLATKK